MLFVRQLLLSILFMHLLCQSLIADTLIVHQLLKASETFKRSNIDSMEFYANKALIESDRLNFSRGRSLSQRTLASALFNKGYFKEAKEKVYQALNSLKQIGTPSEYANAQNLLGLIFMNEGNYLIADSIYKQALNSYSIAKDNLGIAKVHHNLGVVAFYRNDLEESVSYYLQAVHEADKLDELELSAQISANLGLVFTTQKDFGRAIIYLQKALEKYNKTNDFKGKAKTLSGIGTAYFNKAQYDSSFQYHNRALLIFEQINDLSGRSESLNNLAEVLIEKEDFKGALSLLQISDSLRKISGDAYGLAITAKNFGKAYSGLGLSSLAENSFNDAFVKASDLSADWLLAEILLSRSQFFESQGDFRKALQDWKTRTLINEEIYSKERTQTIAELETRYKSEKSRADVAMRDKQIIVLEKEGQKLEIIMILIISISVLAGVFAFFIQKRNQLKHKSNLAIAAKDLQIQKKQKELEEKRREALENELLISANEQEQIKSELNFKKRELTQLALYINQQNEALESLRNELSGLKPGENKKLERELEQRLNISKQREAFEMNVDLMNEDFYHRLNTKYQNLTENDKKLCAMIRLGLSSKEIASIVNISPKSVDMNRYRLRKKMNLEIEEELGQFLMKI
jgi:tetratricopeptide (TPR) repeat protein